jgi:hypothetical protein
LIYSTERPEAYPVSMRQYKFICDYLAIFGRNKFDAAQCPRQFRVPNKGVE